MDRGSDIAGPAHARALASLGALLAWLGELAEGRRLVAEAIVLWRELGDDRGHAFALETLGWLLIYDAGDDTAALRAFEQSLALRQAAGDAAGARRSLVGVCQVLVALDETERAESLSRELLASARGDARAEHFAYHFLADCSLIRGECAAAAVRYRDSLRAARALGDVLETSLEVQGIAMAAAGLGDARQALLLAGAVEALWDSLGARISVRFWDALLERYLGTARARLGTDGEVAWHEGRAFAFDAAVELALATAVD